jgi:hypothetical protein
MHVASSSAAQLVPLTQSLFDRAQHLSRTGKRSNIGRHALAPGMAVALVRDNQVIGAGGLALYAGRLQAWMLVSRNTRKRDIVAGVRLARRWLDIHVQQHRCIEIYVRALAPWRESFVRALGLRDTGESGHLSEPDDVYCLYVKEATSWSS